jgi:hypothetical protein
MRVSRPLKGIMTEEIAKIEEVIREFQMGYLNRNLDSVEKFMDLFCDEDTLEVIGTNAYVKGQGEWCLDKIALKKLIIDDWQDWGHLRPDIGKMTFSFPTIYPPDVRFTE